MIKPEWGNDKYGKVLIEVSLDTCWDCPFINLTGTDFKHYCMAMSEDSKEFEDWNNDFQVYQEIYPKCPLWTGNNLIKSIKRLE